MRIRYLGAVSISKHELPDNFQCNKRQQKCQSAQLPLLWAKIRHRYSTLSPTLNGIFFNRNFLEVKIMTRYESYPDYQCCYEYHGNTSVEITRKQDGITIGRDWILFDSVEEAQEFFYYDCDIKGGCYVQ
jgi:hypothetical protein